MFELCCGGDLLKYISKTQKVSESMGKYLFKQILDGIEYCHKKKIVHRDIKLDNILLNAAGELKICDFGVSKIIGPNEYLQDKCGTPAYIAPEILRYEPCQGFSSDVWSLGVVLYAILYGTVPFKAQNINELNKLIIAGKFTLKDSISSSARNLLNSMFNIDQHKRITIKEIKRHIWLKSIKKFEVFSEYEKEKIKQEYSYYPNPKNESEKFTEHNLDSSMNGSFKNLTTKSNILGPFNTVKSDESSESELDALQKKEIMKFSDKIRDFDRQYEKNNNGDLDNGVYNKFVYSSHSSCTPDEDDEDFKNKKSMDNKSENELVCLSQKEKIDNQSSISQIDGIEEDCNDEKLEVNEELVKIIEDFGYSKNFILESLQNYELNQITTSYYLLNKKK